MRCVFLRIAIAALQVGLGLAPLSARAAGGDPNLGRRHLAEGRYAAAEEEFSRALASARPEASLYYHRALARHHQENLSGARQDLDVFLARAPRATPALALRAQILLVQGDPAGALRDAQAALDSAADSAELLLLRARARHLLGQREEARADLARILERDPRHVPALLERAELALAANDAAAADADYAEAVRAAPDQPEAHYKLGLAKFRRLEFAAAIEHLGTAARLAPTFAPIARALGCARYGAGDFAPAQEDLQRAVALDPERSTYARLLLHLVQRRLGQTPAPLPDPSSPAGAEAWAGQLVKFLRHEISEDELFLAAQNSVPAAARPGRFCEAHFYLGSVRLLDGDVDAARHHLREAGAGSPSDFAEHTLARAEFGRLPPPAPRRTRRT